MLNRIFEAQEAAAIKRLIAEKNMDEDDELIHDMIEGETNFYEALSITVRQMQQEQAMAEATKLQIANLQERKARFEHRADKMRELVQEMMQIVGERKAVLPEATISMRTVPPKVLIQNEESIPEQYWKVERKLDKRSLLDALKNEAGVSGAILSNGGESVTIRSK